MRNSRFSVTLATVGASAVAAVALAGPAAAVTAPSPLTVAKASAIRTINSQLFGLTVANIHIATDRAAAADKAALAAPVKADITALTALRTAVSKDATTAAVAGHVNSVKALHVTDFVLPRVSTVLRSDDLNAVVVSYTAAGTRYSTAIAAAQKAGKNVTTVNKVLADYNAKVAAVKTAATAAHTTAMPLVVSGFPANAPQLAAAAKSIRTAEANLVVANRDARALQLALHTR
jgi:hypothetical protein